MSLRSVVLAARVGWALARFGARWSVGRPLDGHRKTDATFVRAGGRAFSPTDRVTRWSYLPEWKRAAVRHGVVFALVAEAAGLVAARAATLTATAAVLLALAGRGTLGLVRAVRGARLRRDVVEPLAYALHARVSQPPTGSSASWLTVPATYAVDPATPVRIALPAGFDREAHGAAVQRLALDRLAIEEPVVTWTNYGQHPAVTIAVRPSPPARVELADIMPAIRAAARSALVLGMGSGGRVVSVSTDLDSPHVALSAPSNAGKSTAVAIIVAQEAFRGACFVVLDIKAESHTWAFGLPNAAVMTRLEPIHSAAIYAWQVVEQRQQMVEAAARRQEPRPEFGKLWIVAEEMNLTRKRLAELWRDYREDDPERAKRLPKTSPALDALANISFAGRSVQVHLIMVAQRLTAAATGDNTGAVRENVGIRYLIKPRVSTWKMLADGAALPAFLKGQKGRAHVVVDGHAEEVQGAYATGPELIALATGGTVTPLPRAFAEIEGGTLVLMSGRMSGHSQSDAEREVEGSGRTPGRTLAEPATAALEPATPDLVTLAAAVADGLVSGSVEAASRALRRAGDAAPAPHVVGGERRYERTALAAWQASRPRARSGVEPAPDVDDNGIIEVAE